jgi:amino acid transporter
MTTQAVAGSRPDLVRRLGLWSSIGIVIGITIGSGIFRTPAGVASRVPDPVLMLGVWVLGGVISLCGALSVAELAAAMPNTGGWYVYLREGWGRLAGFLFGWAQLLLIRASATAAIAVVFGEYFLRSLGYDPSSEARTPQYVAAAAVVLCSGFNVRGIQLSALVTGLSTVSKFGALTGLVVASYLLGGDAGASTSNLVPSGETVNAGLFGLALISALWAYDGFSDVASVAGEVANPQRTLPRAIIAGTCAIVAMYLAVNIAYLYVNSAAVVAKSPLVAADTMGALFGRAGVSLTSIVVAISAFGALNADILLGPRVFFALAQDGLFFRRMTSVHPRYGTPWVAILLTMALALVFVLTQTFEQLADTFVLAIWPFYACAIAGLYRLRRTRPDLPRPYKVPGYPYVPAVFVAGVTYLVVNALVTDPIWSSTTFALVLAGVPVYYVMFKPDGRQ